MADDMSQIPGPKTDGADPLVPMELSPEEQIVLTKVADVVRKISFGTVLLVIQDGKVVQIEAAEKFRLR
ncbi:MAG: YezD family protein [Actinomycetota bacterium]